MASKSKASNVELHAVCAAVKRVRETYGETLQVFAQRVGISMNSLSRFELGKQIPADFGVLNSLEYAAHAKGLTEESRVFDEARQRVRFNAFRSSPSSWRPEVPEVVIAHSPQEWRMMQAGWIAVRVYPEIVQAIEKAAGPALAIVDEVLRSSHPTTLDAQFYSELERRLITLAERRAFEKLKTGEDK
jgi:transcriptional regulator with XRE-family HTH domain